MEATMAITFDPGAPPATVFDKGPLADLARHFAAVPGYQIATADHRDLFWWDWGPAFYRGRLNKTAKVIGIASDRVPPSASSAATSSETPANVSRDC
jgi:hypothetical protein